MSPDRPSDPFAPPEVAGPEVPGRGSLLTETVRRWVRHAPVLVQIAVVCGSLSPLLEIALSGTGDPQIVTAASLFVSGLSGTAATSAALRVVHAREGRSEASTGAIVRGATADTIGLLGPLIAMQFQVLLGLLLGVFPGLWLLARWSLAWPVLVLERSGLERAATLSVGQRWPLFVAWSSAWVVVLIVWIPVLVLAGQSRFGEWIGSMWATVVILLPRLVVYELWLRTIEARADLNQQARGPRASGQP